MPAAPSSSGQNDAPRSRRCWRSASWAGPSGGGSGSGGATRRSVSRNPSAIRPSSAPIPPAPIHTTSPLAHSASRSAGRYPRTRERRTSDSRIDAGIAAPWSCSIASTSAVGPCRGVVAACHSGRNLPSAAASTGSTSRAERGERPSADRTQDVGVAPLAFEPAGAELAADHAALRLERCDGAGDAILADAEPRRDVGGPERPVGPRVPGDEPLERRGRGLGEHRRHAERQRRAERVPVPRRRPRRRRTGPAPRPAGGSRARRVRARRASQTGRRSTRAETSSALRSPSRRSRSCTSSALRARRPSDRCCSSSSSSASAVGSISSRRSSAPSSSRSSSRSSESAAARRSASGASSSYM